MDLEETSDDERELFFSSVASGRHKRWGYSSLLFVAATTTDGSLHSKLNSPFFPHLLEACTFVVGRLPRIK